MMVILRKNLDLASGSFDTAICVGTFNEKHTPPTCLDELVWISKDGIIIFDYHNLCGFRVSALIGVYREV